MAHAGCRASAGIEPDGPLGIALAVAGPFMHNVGPDGARRA